MANTHSTLTALFTAIANAIRAKTGGTAQIVADNFPTEIAGISTGVDTSDATASASDIVSPKTAYVNGEKVTGTISPGFGGVTPSGTPSMLDDYNIRIIGSYTPGSSYALLAGRSYNIGAFSHLSNFGDATAADVATGKRFTSTAGLMATGTANIMQTVNAFNNTGERLISTGNFTTLSTTYKQTGYFNNAISTGQKMYGMLLVQKKDSSIHGAIFFNALDIIQAIGTEEEFTVLCNDQIVTVKFTYNGSNTIYVQAKSNTAISVATNFTGFLK